MQNPIVMTYTEARETFAVHADGSISRPAIAMGPSGRWRFVGIADGRGRHVATFPELVRRLRDDPAALPLTFHVADLDGGTLRHHGHAIRTDALRLLSREAPEMVARLDTERRERERAAAAEAAAARLETARKARSVGTWDGVEVRRNRDGYCVIDGQAVAIGLDMDAAAARLGAALLGRAAA